MRWKLCNRTFEMPTVLFRYDILARKFNTRETTTLHCTPEYLYRCNSRVRWTDDVLAKFSVLSAAVSSSAYPPLGNLDSESVHYFQRGRRTRAFSSFIARKFCISLTVLHLGESVDRNVEKTREFPAGRARRRSSFNLYIDKISLRIKLSCYFENRIVRVRQWRIGRHPD